MRVSWSFYKKNSRENSRFSIFLQGVDISLSRISQVIRTCCGPQAARSRVALPSHTQSCALVVDSRGGRWWWIRLPDASWFAAARAPARTGTAAPVRSPGESGGWGLNLLAYTTQETTKTTIAKQNAASSTYIPISSGLMRAPTPWWRTPTPPIPPEDMPLAIAVRCCRACTRGSCLCPSFSSFSGNPLHRKKQRERKRERTEWDDRGFVPSWREPSRENLHPLIPFKLNRRLARHAIGHARIEEGILDRAFTLSTRQ